MSYLRRLVERGAQYRYGPRPPDALEDLSLRSRAWHTIDHELGVIAALGFAGYFLVVWDIVQFCERNDILCQGRGSAANSAVCYALGITKVDAVSLGLLFERFLSAERDGPPDIDIDIESGRREEVIQYVYERHGRHHAAQVANVITYRARSAVRDMARALGYAPGQQDAWSKQIDRSFRLAAGETLEIPAAVLDLATQIEHAPRHLGIHSGGMVMCDRPVSEVCPVEWGRMEGRSVLQWDKDDCAAAGLVKFDLLGLGMLSALHRAIDLIREHRGVEVDLATIPQEDEVYAMLCRADTVGVFQIESRAQMATLPRLKPRRFYDLVVEVALIRPGPIQGGSVHPYIRRRNGKEPVTYLHPLLENSLGKTLGVPLFQEQLMQMAIDVAGFTPAQADELRQAMGSKRSRARMLRLRDRLYAGMARNGITGDIADQIFMKMQAFANYGFPESHSVSFAYLVYASAWIKLHEPAAFCAALVNSQPMGFWSPHSLVQDARRHGVVVRSPDLNASGHEATLEQCTESSGGLAVRLGVSSVRGISSELAREIAVTRPFSDMEDLVRRVPRVQQAHLESLATAGVFDECFGARRRDALWSAGAVAQSRPDRLAGITVGATAPYLPGMAPMEQLVADLWSTGISTRGHPTELLRGELSRLGVVAARDLSKVGTTKVTVAGTVTHRQRPMTARGVTFINLEDETGLINVVCSQGCWARYRRVAHGAGALFVRGRLEVGDGGVVNVVAEHIAPLVMPAHVPARNFR
jgi:error-prone DNA polymerase